MGVGSKVVLKKNFAKYMKVVPRMGVVQTMDMWQRNNTIFEIVKIRKGLFGDVTVVLSLDGKELDNNFYMDMLEDVV